MTKAEMIQRVVLINAELSKQEPPPTDEATFAFLSVVSEIIRRPSSRLFSSLEEEVAFLMREAEKEIRRGVKD